MSCTQPSLSVSRFAKASVNCFTNTHARMKRSNVIACLPTSDPEGEEAIHMTWVRQNTNKSRVRGGEWMYVPNLATSSDSRCCGSFMPN